MLEIIAISCIKNLNVTTTVYGERNEKIDVIGLRTRG